MSKLLHYEESAFILATPEDIFNYVDDHTRFSSHMNKSSWMMGGGSMNTQVDEGKGQRVGSHIRMSGKVFGINLSLDESVTLHEPPYAKTWETVGEPKLLVIGHYIMGIEIKPKDKQSIFKVYIDYDLPLTNSWLGRLFGGVYAKWCVRQMLSGTINEFSKKK